MAVNAQVSAYSLSAASCSGRHERENVGGVWRRYLWRYLLGLLRVLRQEAEERPGVQKESDG